jgi:hypothetical protein
MSQLRTFGIRLAVVGTIGGGIVGIVKLGRRSRLKTADILAMNESAFDQHIRSIGLKAQVEDALGRLREPATHIDRGAA